MPTHCGWSGFAPLPPSAPSQVCSMASARHSFLTIVVPPESACSGSPRRGPIRNVGLLAAHRGGPAPARWYATTKGTSVTVIRARPLRAGRAAGGQATLRVDHGSYATGTVIAGWAVSDGAAHFRQHQHTRTVTSWRCGHRGWSQQTSVPISNSYATATSMRAGTGCLVGQTSDCLHTATVCSSSACVGWSYRQWHIARTTATGIRDVRQSVSPAEEPPRSAR